MHKIIKIDNNKLTNYCIITKYHLLKWLKINYTVYLFVLIEPAEVYYKYIAGKYNQQSCTGNQDSYSIVK